LVSSGSIPLGSVTSDFDNGTVQDLRSLIRAPVSPLLDSALHGISSSVPHNLSSPVRVPSTGNHSNPSGHGENAHSFGQMKFGFQGMPIIHPHSLPEYHDGVTNGVPYNSSSTKPAMAMNINSRPGDGIDQRYIQRVGSGSLTSHSFEGGKCTESSHALCCYHYHYNVVIYPVSCLVLYN